jgi:hypothetical protein
VLIYLPGGGDPVENAERLARHGFAEGYVLAALHRHNEMNGFTHDDDELERIASFACMDKVAFVDEWLRFVHSV